IAEIAHSRDRIVYGFRGIATLPQLAAKLASGPGPVGDEVERGGDGALGLVLPQELGDGIVIEIVARRQVVLDLDVDVESEGERAIDEDAYPVFIAPLWLDRADPARL